MSESRKPNVLAQIREKDCIGCTKCIDACPVDAILGSDKLMHTVIASECIGCKLCVPPCPVDCIELIPTPETHIGPSKDHVLNRFRARKERLKEQEAQEEKISYFDTSLQEKKNYILEAVKRKRGSGLIS